MRVYSSLPKIRGEHNAGTTKGGLSAPAAWFPPGLSTLDMDFTSEDVHLHAQNTRDIQEVEGSRGDVRGHCARGMFTSGM